jgi:hypothetical protein
MKTTFKNLEITSTFLGDKAWDVKGLNTTNRNNHLITVKNTDTNKKVTFDFWASIANPGIETEEELLSAFECFVSDSIAGDMDVFDFISEFGYSDDMKEAKRIYKACTTSNKKLRKVYDGDIYELANELNQ